MNSVKTVIASLKSILLGGGLEPVLRRKKLQRGLRGVVLLSLKSREFNFRLNYKVRKIFFQKEIDLPSPSSYSKRVNTPSGESTNHKEGGIPPRIFNMSIVASVNAYISAAFDFRVFFLHYVSVQFLCKGPFR